MSKHREMTRWGNYFAGKTIEELISIFNKDQPCRGWTGARGRFLAALHEAFLKSDVDCSSFISGNRMSLVHPIRLEGDAIVQESES